MRILERRRRAREKEGVRRESMSDVEKGDEGLWCMFSGLIMANVLTVETAGSSL